MDRVSTEYPLYIVSEDGHSSAIGMMAMQIFGFTNIKSLSGGMIAWDAYQASRPATPVPVASTPIGTTGTVTATVAATITPAP